VARPCCRPCGRRCECQRRDRKALLRKNVTVRRLPTGTVTLLFTDIEGSTELLQELGRDRYVHALEEHRRLLREAFSRHDGVEVELQGDSFHFAFASADDAVLAAAAGQRRCLSTSGPMRRSASASAFTPAHPSGRETSTRASTSIAALLRRVGVPKTYPHRSPTRTSRASPRHMTLVQAVLGGPRRATRLPIPSLLGRCSEVPGSRSICRGFAAAQRAE
jgi:hypothetical protein